MMAAFHFDDVTLLCVLAHCGGVLKNLCVTESLLIHPALSPKRGKESVQRSINYHKHVEGFI